MISGSASSILVRFRVSAALESGNRTSDKGRRNSVRQFGFFADEGHEGFESHDAEVGFFASATFAR